MCSQLIAEEFNNDMISKDRQDCPVVDVSA